MQQFTPQGQKLIQDLAQRYGVSTDAVVTMLQALIKGHGTMAQFNHPEFAGSGQWMQGGMTMVGDMFNHGLKATVDGLCNELSNLLANQPLFAAPGSSQLPSQGGEYNDASLFVSPTQAFNQWWPSELGTPSSTGAQNNVRYAVFPASRRLAVEANGHLTIYDSVDHQIGGVAQQQGGGASVTFTSQYGVVRCTELPVVSVDGMAPQAHAATRSTAPPADAAGVAAESDIFAKIERLAELKRKGMLTDEEFSAKKQDLLSKL